MGQLYHLEYKMSRFDNYTVFGQKTIILTEPMYCTISFLHRRKEREILVQKSHKTRETRNIIFQRASLNFKK